MIILDNLDLPDVEIMRVLRGAPSEGLTAKAVKSSGDNLISAENVSKRLQKLSDLKLVILLENVHYRLHLDGENLFWGRGELWSKFLHVVYIGSLEMGLTLETIQRMLGEPEWKFKSALEVLRPRGFLHRNDVTTMGGKEVHLWELTPEGKKYVSEEFSTEQTRTDISKAQRQKTGSTKAKERRMLTSAQEKLCWDNNPHICNLCGNQINRISDVEFDHSKAFAKGGKTNLTNVKLSHRACNKQKGEKSLTEARKMLGYYSTIKKSDIENINKDKFDFSLEQFFENNNHYVRIRNSGGTIESCTILYNNEKCNWWDMDQPLPRHIYAGEGGNVIIPKHSEKINSIMTVMGGDKVIRKIKLLDVPFTHP